MAKLAADRYASMAELAQTLEDGFSGAPAPPPRRSLWQWLRSLFVSSSPPAPVNKPEPALKPSTPSPAAKVVVGDGAAPAPAAAPIVSKLEETSADTSTPPEEVPAPKPIDQTSADMSQAPEKDSSNTVDMPNK